MNAMHDLPTTIPAYLERLRRALDGCGPALAQDALYDAEERPRAFLRGYDVYDPRAMGFVSDPGRIDPGLYGRLFCYMTSAAAAVNAIAATDPPAGVGVRAAISSSRSATPNWR